MTSHLVGDIVYFANANKHLGYEGFVFLNKDIFILIQSFIAEQPVAFILAGLFILFYFGIAIYLYKKNFRYEENVRKPLSRILEF